MSNQEILEIQNSLYTGEIKDIDKNLKALIRVQKETAIARRIDDELER